jgi:hypothetical protein
MRGYAREETWLSCNFSRPDRNNLECSYDSNRLIASLKVIAPYD